MTATEQTTTPPTDATEATAATPSTTEPATAPEPTPSTTAEQEDTGSSAPHREAAKYRRQLREAEANLDALTARVEALQGDVLAGVLSRDIAIEATGTSATPIDPETKQPKPATMLVQLRNPDDLFALGGVEKTALFDDDGRVDPGKLQNAVGELYATRPELFNTRNKPVPGITDTPEAAPPKMLTWGDALTG